jgi:hypothetical protein
VPPSPPLSRIDTTSIGIRRRGPDDPGIHKVGRDPAGDADGREAGRQHRRARRPVGLAIGRLPVGQEESGDDGNARRGVARDRGRGNGKVAAHVADERADIPLLDVVTGEVLDFGDRAFGSAHGNGSGPSML